MNAGTGRAGGQARVPLTIAIAAVMLLAAVAATDAAYLLAEGSGSFVHAFRAGGHAEKITVWYHRPQGTKVDAPVVFVMHGRARNGETYRRHWIPYAEAGRFILLVPEFSAGDFGRVRHYQFGNVFGPDGALRPETEWSFRAVEDIFDAVTQANALAASRYDIYGHSAGGQFVHRMALLMPAARFRVAIAANPGSYAMPDTAIRYPYGLGGLDSAPERLGTALERRLIVLLGDQDNDPHHASLPRAPQAMAQGAHRFERGERFFSAARDAAARLGVPFNWSLETARGGHSNARMAVAAARFVGHANGAGSGAQAK